MTRVPVPEELAPEARELLLAFLDWCAHPEHATLQDWEPADVVDLFLLEASLPRGNG